jgi:hypothetical protein
MPQRSYLFKTTDLARLDTIDKSFDVLIKMLDELYVVAENTEFTDKNETQSLFDDVEVVRVILSSCERMIRNVQKG